MKIEVTVLKEDLLDKLKIFSIANRSEFDILISLEKNKFLSFSYQKYDIKYYFIDKICYETSIGGSYNFVDFPKIEKKINYKNFLNAVTAFEDNLLRFDFYPEDNFIDIVGDYTGEKVSIKVYDIDEELNYEPKFLNLNFKENDNNVISFDKKIFIEIQKKLNQYIYIDTSRYSVNHIYLKIENKKMSFYATNAKILCVIDLKKEIDIEKSITLILPKKMINDIITISNKLKGNSLSLKIDDKQYIFNINNFLIAVDKPEEKAIDIEPITSQNYQKQIKLHKQKILNFLSITSNTECCKLQFDKNKITITTILNKTIDINYIGESFLIKFNTKFLLTILKSFSEDYFYFEYNDNNSPVKITRDTEKNTNYNQLCYIMPLHSNSND